MANLETINAPNRTFDVEGAVGAVVDVKTTTGSVGAKRGHLLVNIGGAWYAYATTVNPLTQEIGDTGAKKSYDAVGLLLEDAALSTTAVKARVLYAGVVWEQFVRDAGIANAVVTMDALRVAKGHIVFKDEQ